MNISQPLLLVNKTRLFGINYYHKIKSYRFYNDMDLKWIPIKVPSFYGAGDRCIIFIDSYLVFPHCDSKKFIITLAKKVIL